MSDVITFLGAMSTAAKSAASDLSAVISAEQKAGSGSVSSSPSGGGMTGGKAGGVNQAGGNAGGTNAALINSLKSMGGR